MRDEVEGKAFYFEFKFVYTFFFFTFGILKNTLMKKYFTLLFSLVIIGFTSSLTAQSFQWAVKAAGPGIDVATGINPSSSFGFYNVCGYFYGTAMFGPFPLTGTGGSNMFVARYDANGNCIWAQKAGGGSYCQANAITSDGSGNTYVTGFYQGTCTFGTSTNITSLGGTMDIFVAKYDGAGVFQWVRTAGSNLDDDYGLSITMDNTGALYVTGYFWDQATFAPFTIFGTNAEVFVARYDQTGTCLWAKSAGNSNNEYATGIVGIGNSCYLIGYFSGTTTFGTTNLTSAGSDDVFLAQIDFNGNWIWAVKAGGTGWDQGFGICRAYSSPDFYVTGKYNSTAAFGSTNLTSSGFDEVFTARYNNTGTCLWAKSGGSTTGYDHGQAVSSDATGCYVTGNFGGTASFGPYNVTASGNSDVFITHYDVTGTPLWAVNGGGPSVQSDDGNSIVTENTGNTSYIVGSYFGTATFGSTSLGNSGVSDIFITKLCNIQASAGADVSICIGGSTTLGASGGTTYAWTPTGGLSNPNIANPVASPTFTTTYTVTASNASGCTSTDAVTVTVNPLPTANAGFDAFICNGASTTLTATGGGTYAWSPSTGLSNPNIANPIASPTTNTNYTVTVTSPAGCTATDVVAVTVYPAPTASAGPDVSICIGGNTILSATGGATFLWSPTNGLSNPNIPTPTASPTVTITYTVTVTNSFSCTASDAVTVTVNPLPVVTATANNITCSGGTVQLNATGASTYLWTPAGGLNNPSISNPVATVTASTIYTVTGTDANGCVNTDTAAAIVYSLVNPICMVTVDTNSIYNRVVWDKPVATNIDSFRIYREITSNNFQVIGVVPYTAYSIYVDSVYLPLANPNNTNYRYKISVVDTCGAEGQLSPFHQTIFLQASQGVGNTVNLSLIQYSGNTVNQYYIYRDTVGTGNLDLIDSIPGTNTVYTDNNPSQNVTTLRYVLGVDWTTNCNPTVKNVPNTLAAINTSHSNIKNMLFTPDGVTDLEAMYALSIFPNPNNGMFTVSLKDLNNNNCSVTVYDALGQEVYSENIIATKTIDLTILAKGIYSVKVEIDGKQVVKKLVIH